MEDEIKRMKFNKLASELKYLEDELGFINKVLEKVSLEFNSNFHSHMKEIGKYDLLAAKKPEPKLNRAQRRASKKASKASQEIFKKIAKEIHPDKNIDLEESKKKEIDNMFLEASEAKEQDNMLKLFSIAKELKIEIGELSPEHLSIFEKEISEMRTKIAMSKKSWVYMWASSEGAMKEEIIKGYARYYIDKENKTNSEE